MFSAYFGLTLTVTGVIVSQLVNRSQHTVVFSFLGSLLCTSVLFVLWPWHRRPRSHIVLAEIFMVLMLALLTALAFTYSTGVDWDNANTAFELCCLRYMPSMGKISTLMLATGSIVIIFLAFEIGWKVYRILRKAETPSNSHIRDVIYSFIGFILLWLSLGFFVQARSEMGDFVLSDEFAENSWGVGQLLAVLAWLPTFMEFGKAWARKCCCSYGLS